MNLAGGSSGTFRDEASSGVFPSAAKRDLPCTADGETEDYPLGLPSGRCALDPCLGLTSPFVSSFSSPPCAPAEDVATVARCRRVLASPQLIAKSTLGGAGRPASASWWLVSTRNESVGWPASLQLATTSYLVCPLSVLTGKLSWGLQAHPSSPQLSLHTVAVCTSKISGFRQVA